MAYSDFEKAEAFKDTLEVTFQENAEPYSDDKIEEVESLVNNYFDDFITLTPPLTSPLEWKIANVVMLPKAGQNHKFTQGFRPISLLNCTAKIFERIILHRIKEHCKAIDCIPSEQCGFREGHSTSHQLIRVTNIINEGFASKLYTVGVFLHVHDDDDC
ncbi:putative RNA-directed DNA polymerase from transposon X-element [Trichonephila clavipes]|nr:putative RNA-directed DNA polymerase from transposon X-element [Trichonephila clavipes]